jgi:hypothetical protein
VRDAGVTRHYFEVWQFVDEAKAPGLIFQHEMGVELDAAHVFDSVELKRAGGQSDILISQGDTKADQVNPDAFRVELRGGETVSLLLPWQAVEQRQYHWDGSHFVVAAEKLGKAFMSGPKVGSKLWSSGAPPATGKTGAAGNSSEPNAKAPAADLATNQARRNPAELMDEVYALYRSEHGKARDSLRFDFAANVAGDSTEERVLVHGKDLVVFGKKFKGGTSYEYFTLGVAQPSDVTKVEARDVTGDGRAELVVYGQVHAKASKQLGGEVVTRNALFIYSVKESGISRIFAAEVGRSLGDKSVTAEVRLGSGSIELRAGSAKGWSAANYPFPVDRTPYGGLEPLLLPWGDTTVKQYRFKDGKFVAAE